MVDYDPRYTSGWLADSERIDDEERMAWSS
jgi:hypothetical protein